MAMRWIALCFLLLAAAPMLSGCAPAVAVGAGAAGAATAGAAVQERGVGGRAVDARIQTEINKLWTGYNPNLLRWLDLKVYNRRVLVLGRAPSDDIRSEAIRLAWKPAGVREVINEVKVGDTVSYVRSTRDVVLAGEIDTKLALAKNIKNQNYTTRVLDGVVYVMGIARSEAEKNAVLYIVRGVSGVKKVVSYVE